MLIASAGSAAGGVAGGLGAIVFIFILALLLTGGGRKDQ